MPTLSQSFFCVAVSRMAVSLIISFVLGSIFISSRGDESFTESEMRAKFAVIFLSFIIVGILAIISVLPVMTRVRDMHYRHRAAGVVDSFSLAWALGNSGKTMSSDDYQSIWNDTHQGLISVLS